MTLVLTGKGLVLGGWPSKLEVIWVLGIYTSYLHECSGWNKIPYITALAQPFLSVLKQKPPIWSPLFLRVVSPQNLANCWCSEFRPSYLRRLPVPRDISGTCPDGTFQRRKWVIDGAVLDTHTKPPKNQTLGLNHQGGAPTPIVMNGGVGPPFKWATESYVSTPFFGELYSYL